MTKRYVLKGSLVAEAITCSVCTVSHEGKLTTEKYDYLNTLMNSAVLSGAWSDLIWVIETNGE